MAKNYDPDKDYSREIEEAKGMGAPASYIKQLEQERQNKIDDMYGGNEPTMMGSNTTYSSASKSGDTAAINNAVNLYDQYNPDFKGSATTVGTYTDAQDRIKEQMNANSIAWHTADEATKKRLEQANRDLAAALGGTLSFDPATGYWSGVAAAPEIPEYSSRYSSQIDSLLESILNREPFSYDYTTDPTYLAYADQYKRLGDRAREDTLGDIAALNGGYASSWATTAASQAQNDYNQQLSNIIPTLYDAAYNRYLNEDSLKRDDLGLVLDIDQMDYDRYRDTVADSQWEQSFDWNKTVDEWNMTVDKWNMSNTEAVQKFDQMMSKWQLTGVADEEVAAALGVPVGATTESYYFNKAQLELQKAKASGGGGGGSKTEPTDHLADSIARNAQSLIDQTDSYSEGAKYILSAVSSADEFYKIGSQAGIPTSTLNEVFDSFYDQALKTGDEEGGGEEKDYAYYAALMGQQKDPEAWLTANKYSIPSDILEDLYKLLDY